MKKKGTILGYGIVFVIFIAIATILTFIGINISTFELYAGQDATQLSRLEAQSHAHIFYVQKAGKIIFSEITPEEYLSELITTLPIGEENGYYVVRNETHDFLSALDNRTFFQEWIEKVFNEKMQEFSNQHNQPVQYALFLEDDRISAIALEQKNISENNGTYYYWPHFVIYTDFVDLFFSDINLLRRSIILFQTENQVLPGIRQEGDILYDDKLSLSAVVT